uniref:Uncharacterized protein n=1 Tax=Parascaris equorum TaxID=6256 RepID=A0A914SD00_PAREQ
MTLEEGRGIPSSGEFFGQLCCRPHELRDNKARTQLTC